MPRNTNCKTALYKQGLKSGAENLLPNGYGIEVEEKKNRWERRSRWESSNYEGTCCVGGDWSWGSITLALTLEVIDGRAQ